MRAAQLRRRRFHRDKIELAKHRPAIRPGKRIRIPEVQVVNINLPRRREPRMKLRGHLPHRDDLNRRHQFGPHRRQQPFRAMPPLRLKVKHLRPRMHPRVRSPAAVNPPRCAKNLRQPRLEHILNAVSSRLALPPGERRAVIRTHALPPRRPRPVFFRFRHCEQSRFRGTTWQSISPPDALPTPTAISKSTSARFIRRNLRKLLIKEIL